MAANSTVMYSGIDPAGRNSSKVLAPPGGQSSIAFSGDLEAEGRCRGGSQEPLPPAALEEKPNHGTVTGPAAEAAKGVAEARPEGEGEAVEHQHTPAMGPSGKLIEEANQGVRGKVPPGGFSSGAFW